MVELPDDQLGPEDSFDSSQEDSTGDLETLRELVDVLKDEIGSLRHQLEIREREVQELHVLLQQTQKALPVPRENRPWWRRLLRLTTT